jgi:hypothetical protein
MLKHFVMDCVVETGCVSILQYKGREASTQVTMVDSQIYLTGASCRCLPNFFLSEGLDRFIFKKFPLENMFQPVVATCT